MIFCFFFESDFRKKSITLNLLSFLLKFVRGVFITDYFFQLILMKLRYSLAPLITIYDISTFIIPLYGWGQTKTLKFDFEFRNDLISQQIFTKFSLKFANTHLYKSFKSHCKFPVFIVYDKFQSLYSFNRFCSEFLAAYRLRINVQFYFND